MMPAIVYQLGAIFLIICVILQLSTLPKILRKALQNPQGVEIPWYRNKRVLQPVLRTVGVIGSLLVVASIGKLIPGREFFFFLGAICMFGTIYAYIS